MYLRHSKGKLSIVLNGVMWLKSIRAEALGQSGEMSIVSQAKLFMILNDFMNRRALELDGGLRT